MAPPWVVALVDGAETPHEELCEIGKKVMCERLVVGDNDDLKHVINKGLQWTIIKWEIEIDYPELPSIIQRGLNVEHHVGEGHTLISSIYIYLH